MTDAVELRSLVKFMITVDIEPHLNVNGGERRVVACVGI